MSHIRQALNWALHTGQQPLSVQAALDLEGYQQAYLALLRTSTGSLSPLPDLITLDENGEPLPTLEQAGFCCDNQDQLSDANNAIMIADENGQITAANFQAQQLSGYTLESLLGMKIHELGLNGTNTTWSESPHIETHLLHRSGSSIPVEALRTSSRQGQNFSKMYILHRREKESNRDSTVVLEDPLTRLPNRQAFIEQLRDVISHAANRAQQVGILVLHVNEPNALNKRVGLETSQKIIGQVADRLRNSLRQADFLARLGADEFGLILENLPQSKVIQIVAGKLLANLNILLAWGKKPSSYSISIGAGLYPLDGDHAEALLHFADQARKIKR